MLRELLSAGYPALMVTTQEPHRAERELQTYGWTFYAWDCLRGIRRAGSYQDMVADAKDPVEAIQWLTAQDTVLIVHNMHLFFDIPEVLQAIQNGVQLWKSLGSALITVGPSIQLKPEIEKLFHVVDLPLPGPGELLAMQGKLAEGVGEEIETDRASAYAARGLTEFEAETAFALSLVEGDKFDAKTVTDAKAQMIRKSGLMEVWEPVDISEVGGLDRLKGYIQSRLPAFEPDNETLPRPKGIILVGIPGTGKSLSCKATASILGWPLVRLDIGGLKNSLVGESERRMREATRVIDAFGECVVWLDEVEKAFAGTASSGQTDSGTTAGMFGHFLTWMQETKAPVLIMATANNISQLPPEFLRAGRFDAIFFVDLPTAAERREIVGIMNRKYKAQLPVDAPELEGFTGAEIEQTAKDSLFDGLDEALANIVPLSRTMKEEIRGLQEWARNRARAASNPDKVPDNVRRIKARK